MQHLVKRAGGEENFDPKKLYGSVYAACLTLRMSAQEAEQIADTVTQAVQTWIKDKEHVSSDQIFALATKELRAKHPDAAYMYETHRDIS